MCSISVRSERIVTAIEVAQPISAYLHAMMRREISRGVELLSCAAKSKTYSLEPCITTFTTLAAHPSFMLHPKVPSHRIIVGGFAQAMFGMCLRELT